MKKEMRWTKDLASQLLQMGRFVFRVEGGSSDF